MMPMPVLLFRRGDVPLQRLKSLVLQCQFHLLRFQLLLQLAHLLPQNQFAVLLNENAFASFAALLADEPEIQTVFINTDYEVNYRSMVKSLGVQTSYQLYRDYLDNFRINHGRN